MTRGSFNSKKFDIKEDYTASIKIPNKKTPYENKRVTVRMNNETKEQITEIVGNRRDRSIIKELDNAVTLYKYVYDYLDGDTNDMEQIVLAAIEEYNKQEK